MAAPEDKDHAKGSGHEIDFDLWATDPSGGRFHVWGVQAYGVAGPVLLGGSDQLPSSAGPIGFVNRQLARWQRPKKTNDVHLEVRRIVGKCQQIVFETETKDMASAHRKASAIVADIEAGRFTPPSG